MLVEQSKNVTKTCKVCFKDIRIDNMHSLISKNNVICKKCNDKFISINKKIKIKNKTCIILYEYNDFLKEQLYKLKGCGDIEIAPIFLSYKLFWLRLLYHNYILVPAPSNIEDDNRRGFNHVIEIFKEMKLSYEKAIIKKCKFKQSDLNKNERKMIKDKLQILKTKQIKNKNILLVDDVITTGSTMAACVDLLLKAEVKRIVCLVIAHPNDKS